MSNLRPIQDISGRKEMLEQLELIKSQVESGHIRGILFLTAEGRDVGNCSSGHFTVSEFMLAFERWKWRQFKSMDEHATYE